MKNYFIITILLFSVYFSQAQIVNIPDANFKNALINTLCVDTDGNGVGDSDADTNDDGEIQVSEAEAILGLIVYEQSIASLEGIQAFTNLEYLQCSRNELTNIDVSQNTNLLELSCRYNELISLDVSQNTNLLELDCYHNQLSSLDVSQNTNLLDLNCDSNELTNIDVSQNPNLLVLNCGSNQLTSLDVSQNLTLETLDCHQSQISNLDVSQNLDLRFLVINFCQLISLDVSQNHNLSTLYCNDSQLISLNINNGNNHNMFTMSSKGNPNLTCITVDDEGYAYDQECITWPMSSGWCKDEWTEYSEDCALGIVDFELYNINIYPNPVQNTLNIKTDFPIDFIKIYTLQGQLVNETKSYQIDVSLLSSGIYFASIAIDGESIVKKIIKN